MIIVVVVVVSLYIKKRVFFTHYELEETNYKLRRSNIINNFLSMMVCFGKTTFNAPEKHI